MKKLLIFLVSGLTGIAGGYFIGYKVAKKKYLSQADRDVQSVIDAYDAYYGVNSNKEAENNVNKPQEKQKNEEKSSLIDKDSIDYEALKNHEQNIDKYIKVTSAYKSEPEQEVVNPDGQNEKIYLISPEEYNESSCSYTVETLTYYADGVLADDDFNIIQNINDVVGSKALESFGMYEQDVVYVRNDNHQIDYEIVLDERTYAESAPRGIYSVHPDED